MVEVGCAGILVADTLCGPIKAIPPAGQILVLDDMLSTVGGCAANVACGLMKQGIETAVTGCVGNDHGAKIVTGELESRDIDCSQIYSTDQYPTSQTVILIVEGEDRRFIHVFGANAAFSGEQINRDWLTGLKVFYVGGFFAMPSFDCKALAGLFKLCRDHGVLTVLDVVVPQGMKDFEGLDQAQVRQLKLANEDEALYRELLLAQCHELHKAMPFLFEAIADETELLLPNNLTKTDSLLRDLVREIPQDEWDDIEIMGWLYQFYISEKKSNKYYWLIFKELNILASLVYIC